MILRASLVMLLAGLPLAVSNGTASAADCSVTSVADGVYQTVCPGQPGSTQRPAAPTGIPAASCDLHTPLAPSGAALYCAGTTPCYDSASVAILNPPDPATQPTPDTKWHTQICLLTNGSWRGNALWDAQPAQPPSLAVQATEAIGRIQLPTATLRFNPTNRTLVHLATWFWAEGLDGQVRKGTSALGLVAYATPDRLQVDPGDGSGAVTCKWVTPKSDRCTYRYRRSSLAGSALGLNGAPAYKATATAFWTLRFELDDVAIRVPGAPPELHRDVTSAPVVVVEVQTIVTSAC
jgi:hypothetical protein